MVTAISAILASFPACHQARQQSAELWIGGDVNLGDGGKAQLQNITGMVQGSAGIVNLEGPVSERLVTADHLRLWNAPSALAELSGAQVRVAGIANNHAVDTSESGPGQTAKELRDHGILPAGAIAGAAFFEVNGVSIAVTAHDLTRGVPENLEAALASARKKSQVLVSTFHVTGPLSYLPRPELRRAVEIAYHAGANVIAAHGTHMLGPVERREHAVIAWGLGNLTFSCDCTQEEDAMLLRVMVEPDRVVRAEVIPLRAGINQKPAQPAGDAAAIFDLLEAIGSKGLQRHGSTADF